MFGINSVAFCRCVLMIYYFVDILIGAKKTKIVGTRPDFWAQNVPKMLLRPGLLWGAHSATLPRLRSCSLGAASLQGGNGSEKGREGKEMEGRGEKGRERGVRNGGRGLA